ncbi:winged helix DNA-binding domain-containing protein [Pseudactinotalea suaedae]|uniref:winged helix DNA-binding domain-containing protein n=1 Tax=Pseudactinotalea suaedae TaxID=1524924 RepID=UPI0012E27AFA|nr:winged helix DNA-binding domain-containing protein [Pseudactinotalea suaedae]
MSTRAYTWDQLRRSSLARQFPPVRGRGVAAVSDLMSRIGPLQTQTARSAFLGIAARLPGVTPATLTEAYERHVLVRGSSIRGTVHTSTAEHHVALERATRVGQRAMWARTLRLEKTTLEEVWDGIEEFATPAWREVDELAAHLRSWLEQRGEQPTDQLGQPLGRYLAFGHGGLIRRPVAGGWDGQTRPAYRWVGAALADAGHEDTARLAALRASTHEEAMAAVVLLHLRSHGPASRHDVAWWAGVGLREVDAALARLEHRLSVRSGPDGRDYWDVADGVRRPVGDVGVRLLPEFDALMCGYDPRARERFITPEQHAILWNQKNGLVLPPLLHHGRIAGWWRAEGSGRSRRFLVTTFPGVAAPAAADLERAVASAAAVMQWEIADVTLERG